MKNIYVCGPTVYNNPHIGNLRPILVFDIFVKSLKAQGEKVNLIHNITDIDDKIIAKAEKENVSEKEISEKYTKIYFQLLKDLNITTIDESPLVTTNIDGIISFIERLIAKGFAYNSDGTIYFEVSKLKRYGEVSNRRLDEMNFEKTEGKKHPADFALWKKTNIGVQFSSPWGDGRPGWHTECSYFVEKLSKDGLDIHGGGIDLLFPHHENENAQFWALHNKPITKLWKQTGHINVDGIKMSKSIGNILDAQDFVKNNNKNVLRMIFLMTSPTAPINISEKMVEDATKKIEQIKKAFIQTTLNTEIDITNNTLSKYIVDWNFAKAMEVLNAQLKEFNSKNYDNASALIANIVVLGFFDEKYIASKEEKELLTKWDKLKKERKFQEADLLRDKLITQGIL